MAHQTASLGKYWELFPTTLIILYQLLEVYLTGKLTILHFSHTSATSCSLAENTKLHNVRIQICKSTIILNFYWKVEHLI